MAWTRVTEVEAKKWSNSEIVWKMSLIGFADGFHVRCEMKEDSKITSCLGPEQLKG